MKASSRAFCSAAETKRDTVVSLGKKQLEICCFLNLGFERCHFAEWLHFQKRRLDERMTAYTSILVLFFILRLLLTCSFCHLTFPMN